MIQIGITGQTGFIGTHLFHRISQRGEQFTYVPSTKISLTNPDKYAEFVSQCDVIIHLASVIRHPDESYLYQENSRLTDCFIEALRTSNSSPHIIFVSSIKQDENTSYGRSKKRTMTLLQDYSHQQGLLFHGIISPNVFGPLTQPDHNSFIASFCNQIQSGIQPQVIKDVEVPLVYIDSLCNQIIELIEQKANSEIISVYPEYSAKVTTVLEILESFHNECVLNGVIPDLRDKFHRDLFLTFLSFLKLDDHYPKKLDKKVTGNSYFAELVKAKVPGQTSFSLIEPGVIRGNHYHTRKFERFIALKGQVEVRIRKINSNNVQTFIMNGDESSYIDIPPWHVHSIQNIGKDEVYMVYSIKEFFKEENPDTFALKP